MKANGTYFAALLLASLVVCSVPAAEAIYENNAAIVKLLQGLGDNSAANLPFDRNNPAHTGRSSSDYSMRMAYAPERQTALYAGGNHNDGRRNDCWEYHLGSNTWHRLFPGEGGDHYLLKGIVMYRMREFEAKNKDRLDSLTLADFKAFLKEEDRQKLDEQVIPWWNKNVVFKDGMVTTPTGGPIMPSHTWDGLAYDPLRKRLLWSAGAGPNGECFNFHRLVTGMTAEELAKAQDVKYTEMWEFDSATAKWACYRQPKTGPCPDFRGMGQSLEYLPDQQKFIWYIAASNVAPHSYQMWSFDPVNDTWAELRPNGGKSINDLVHKLKVAPDGEQVIRYSPQQKKLYGFQSSNVFSYDVARNEWAKVCTDERIDAHDAEVMIAHDSINDVFIYTRKSTNGPLVRLAIFDPTRNAWEAPEIQGTPLPSPQYEKLKGYFHPGHNVYVVVGGGWTPTWVYRFRKQVR
jgi:hypothetical protein